MASARPTGPNPNSLLVRGIAGLSVVVALIGVIAVFTKGNGGSSAPSGQPSLGGTPAATRTPTPSATPSATPTPTPTRVQTATTAASPTSARTAAGTPTAAHSQAPSPTTSHLPGTPVPTPVGPTLSTPAVGSYSYATTGGEQTSFPGTARTYPSTTAIKISNAGCGVDETWTPISQHSETQQLCIVNNQVHLVAYATTISFFGQTITQKFNCSNGLIYATSLRAGQTWSFSCSGSGGKVTQHLKAIGFQTIDVGTGQVRTLHISVSSKISGSDSGTTKENYWIRTGPNPFMVRNTAVVNAKSGAVTYSEAYTIQLNHF